MLYQNLIEISYHVRPLDNRRLRIINKTKPEPVEGAYYFTADHHLMVPSWHYATTITEICDVQEPA